MTLIDFAHNVLAAALILSFLWWLAALARTKK